MNGEMNGTAKWCSPSPIYVHVRRMWCDQPGKYLSCQMMMRMIMMSCHEEEEEDHGGGIEDDKKKSITVKAF